MRLMLSTWRFRNMLNAARNLDHPSYEDFKEYLDPNGDLEAFYLEGVKVCIKFAFKPRNPRSTKDSRRNRTSVRSSLNGYDSTSPGGKVQRYQKNHQPQQLAR